MASELTHEQMVATLVLMGWEPWSHSAGGYMTLINPPLSLVVSIDNWWDVFVMKTSQDMNKVLLNRHPVDWDSAPPHLFRDSYRTIMEYRHAN